MNIRKASDQFWTVAIVLLLTIAFGFLWGVKSAEIIADQNVRLEELIR